MASSSSRRRPEIALPQAPTAEVSRAEHIGEELKAMFDAVASAPLPPEIEALVEELEQRRVAEEHGPRKRDRRS
ncbi:MAG: hypothetical protein JSR45_00015 [Proteobacteria bacterium]|nr:hypothetical protein [Pseudomonadota bacterium]